MMFMTLVVREGGSGCPKMGADVEMGEPGLATSFLVVGGAGGAGELYMYVAKSTIEDPMTNARVIGYEKRATDARKEIMMDNEVANPFLRTSASTLRAIYIYEAHMMLSE